MARGKQKLQSQQKAQEKKDKLKKSQGSDQKQSAQKALKFSCPVCKVRKLLFSRFRSLVQPFFMSTLSPCTTNSHHQNHTYVHNHYSTIVLLPLSLTITSITS